MSRGAKFITTFHLTMILMFMQLSETPFAEQNQQSCVPSSCGHIHNISFPFRLRTDPKHCGDENYELSCEGNRTVIKISPSNCRSGLMNYTVQAISYDNSTIRLVDPGIREDVIFSLPRHFIKVNYYFFPFDIIFTREGISVARPITIISCPVAIYSSVIVEISNYLNRSGASNVSSDLFEGHTYATMTELSPSVLRVGCSVDLMSLISWPVKDANANISILDLHNALAYGFELSWSRIFCNSSRDVRCGIPMTDISIVCEQSISIFGYIFCVSKHTQGQPIETGEVYLGDRILGLFALAIRVILFPCVVVFLMLKFRRRHLSIFDAIESFLHSENNFMPIRYPYSNIRKMTKNFKEKLGQGGYGSVYKGKLQSGPSVAVKMLSKLKDDGKDFINEVATIGRIHHLNVVRLIGFCAERSKRALVYDFMPNGSLDKYITPQEGGTMLSWERKFEIALGVARGIEYLHKGCDIQILHFDIKPHNILLDENFTPKLSDFGLAKLYPTDNSIVTLTAARGTIGYVAPQLINRSIGPISYKADVYSFGMLLIEIAGLKTNLADRDQDMSSQYFPYWIYDKLDKEKEIVVDDMHDYENKIVKKITLVALWCIQMNPLDRPSMTKAVEMLEGDLQALKTPPRPSESLQPPCSAFNLSSVSSTQSAKLLDSCSDSAEIDVMIV